MTAATIAWGSATDTMELNMSAARFAAADTTYIPLAVAFADPPPRPAPTPPPVRLPRRLRRRATSALSLALLSAAGFTTALTAAGAW
jgi:hypothetical protein